MEPVQGIEVVPATNDTRAYLESPVPVANRSHETEEKIKNKMEKNKAGRYCEFLILRLY